MSIKALTLASFLLLLGTLPGCGGGSVSDGPLSFSWPPVVGERYPHVELQDISGKTVRLSSFEGRVLVIEPIGMT